MNPPHDPNLTTDTFGTRADSADAPASGLPVVPGYRVFSRLPPAAWAASSPHST